MYKYSEEDKEKTTKVGNKYDKRINISKRQFTNCHTNCFEMKHLAYNQKIIETRANHPADGVEKRAFEYLEI
jgi:hypothetical protein